MTETQKPPFRTDHVGSLLRPAALAAARGRASRSEIGRDALRAEEDKAIGAAVRLQEDAGLNAITDGEFRRAMWHTDFLLGIDGIVATQGDYAVSFQGENGETATTSSMLVIKDKIRRSKPIMIDHYAFVKANTARTAKICILSPTYLHMRGGRHIVDQKTYPDMDAFWDDIVAVYRAAIRDLAAAGCTYLQLDDVSFACLCDESIRAQVARDGEDPDELPLRYARIINRLIAERPASMTVTVYTCRGNQLSMWMTSGGYDAVAEMVFGTLEVDGLFLEYDSDRAGDFTPLRYVPNRTKAVLGLVSTKSATLETKDDLKRRIDQAARHMPLENLCLSPQCGFASSHFGNKVSEDIERRKLALVAETARAVWGSI
ncbi:MAG: 5-methyltetrahydropteroyltriglutamate--homocysteine S-methyltransferase [Alphaproteobacteria bacterium]|nr:5-methyltetrahydropteroyltriglutamate--homocysteine S-methyltransferase [Alphaproteobacteria bacterium]